MVRINENFLKLKASYLFADIARRVSEFQAANPDSPIIKMGIGDASDPQTRDSPQVDVTISKGFWIQKYEMTLADYYRVRRRSYGSRDILIPHGNRPMTALKGPSALDMGRKTIADGLKKNLGA